MPKMNIDEQTSLFEPIEVTLEGKTYVITTVTQELMDKVTTEAKNDLPLQFNLLTGANIDELKKIDVRKIGLALRFITKSITASLEGVVKNA